MTVLKQRMRRAPVGLPIVQAGLLFPTFDYAAQVGADTNALRLRAGLPEEVFDDPTHFVPASGWYRLFRELALDTGCEDIGWRVACANPLKAYSREFVEGISSAPSLLESMRVVERTHKRHCNNHHVWVRVLGDFGYVFHREVGQEPGYEQRAAFRAAGIVLIVQAYLGDDWAPDLIVTETPLDTIPAATLETTRVLQRRGYGAIRIPRAALAATHPHPFTADYALGEPTAANARGQVKQLLRSYGASPAMPSVHDLADMMHVSSRSLQRHLAAQGSSCQALADEARYEAARDLLQDSALSITDISRQLGYKDPSHFSRSFRRISGLAPGEYRAGFEAELYPTASATAPA
jgi:AraC-like DNA-binding protein